MSGDEKGQAVLHEIISQPAAWLATIDLVEAAAWRIRALAEGVQEVILTGCGSALNVSYTAAATFQHLTGLRARAVPAAELVFFPDTVFSQDCRCLVVAISRSGETTETVRACEAARARGLPTLSITCYPDSPLAQMADLALVLEAANEESVVTTRSLTAMVLCGQLVSAIVAEHAGYLGQLRQLPVHGEAIMARAAELGQQMAANEALTRFAFVGSGPFFGLARECQLKLKEMVLQPSDAYPTFDFRHGPKSNVDENMLVTLLMSDSARRDEIAFLEEMKSLNGVTLVLCDQAGPEVERLADYLFEVGSGLPEYVRDILYVPPVHFLAYHRALLRGLDPANPTNLTYWVALAES